MIAIDLCGVGFGKCDGNAERRWKRRWWMEWWMLCHVSMATYTITSTHNYTMARCIICIQLIAKIGTTNFYQKHSFDYFDSVHIQAWANYAWNEFSFCVWCVGVYSSACGPLQIEKRNIYHAENMHKQRLSSSSFTLTRPWMRRMVRVAATVVL